MRAERVLAPIPRSLRILTGTQFGVVVDLALDRRCRPTQSPPNGTQRLLSVDAGLNFDALIKCQSRARTPQRWFAQMRLHPASFAEPTPPAGRRHAHGHTSIPRQQAQTDLLPKQRLP